MLPGNHALHHVAGGELESVFDVGGEYLVGPVQVNYERLEGLQLPQDVASNRVYRLAVRKKIIKLLCHLFGEFALQFLANF